MYRREKLLFALLFVFGLSALLGGCVGVRGKFLGVAERAPGLDPDPGRSFEPRVGEVSSPVLACGLREVSPKEAGIDAEALWKDSQIVALKEQLERRGLKPILGALRLFASQSVKLGLLPFGTEGGIAFEERAGQRAAVALVKQASGTLNIFPNGREELWTLLSSAEVEGVLNTIKQDQAFVTFEKSLASQGWRLQLVQSIGIQTTDKGLLYLAVTKDLSSRSTIEYYRIQVSRSGGSYRMVAGSQRALCNQGDAQILGMPAGAVMSIVGAYGAELQAMPAEPCLLGLGALACLSRTCYARKPSEPELNDLLAIVRKSSEYQGLRAQFLSETPEDAWYTSSQDMQLAIVAFTLKRDVRDPDHFVVYPSVMFLIDYVSKTIQDVVISQVDEATLDRALLTSLKDPAYHKTVALNPAVTKELKEAKQARKVTFVKGNQPLSSTQSQAHTALRAIMGPKPGPICVCTKRSPGGEIDFTCFDLCLFSCLTLCDGLAGLTPDSPAVLRACRVSCGAICREGCRKPSVCIEYKCIGGGGPGQITPMGGSQ